MKEYRIMAYFSGTVYGPRSYKRKIFNSLEEAKETLPQAIDYYDGYPYGGRCEKVQIESREVTEWEVENG